MATRGTPFSVLVHPYKSPGMVASAYELGNPNARNVVVFIGGLHDGPHTTPYIRAVAKALEQAKHVNYSVFEMRLRSSFIGFGTSSLATDVVDISSLVKYLRSIGREKIVLFGHSTGCQDCMEYANYAKHQNEPVDGFILQAPVSDREGLAPVCPDMDDAIEYATKMIAEGKSDQLVPKDNVPSLVGAPITAYRLHSLLAKGGDDDYFSSDLDEETVQTFWGRFTKPVLVAHSENDEYVPKTIDQRKLCKTYQAANPLVSQLSDLIPGTGHTVNGEDAQEWLAKRVVEFLAAEV